MIDLPDWYPAVVSPLDRKLGISLTVLTPERVVGHLDVEGNTQPFGLLHGGASAVLVETLGSMGAIAHAYPEKMAVGVDLNITHLRPARSGRVTGIATAEHLGRTVASYSVEIFDDEQRKTALGRLTCQLIPRPEGLGF